MNKLVLLPCKQLQIFMKGDLTMEGILNIFVSLLGTVVEYIVALADKLGLDLSGITDLFAGLLGGGEEGTTAEIEE